jgi:hypothetical protein
MFEKISNAAEKLATNVSESRRGFLVRMGQAALGVTGVVAGLLALPSAAQASGNGFCEVYTSPLGGRFMTGYCVCANPCRLKWNPLQCHRYGPAGGILRLCDDQVTGQHTCQC